MSLTEAESVIRSSSSFSDLTLTVYGTALNWLYEIGAVESTANGAGLQVSLRALPSSLRRQRLFEQALIAAQPPWLQNGDLEFDRSGDDLPLDALDLAAGIGLDEKAASACLLRAHGQVDLALRAEIGRAGENALVSLLDDFWPGTVTHVALYDDGLGYDIVFDHQGVEWHIEVKSTPKRGRLAIFLSRNEFEVAKRDQHWRLVVVGLSSAPFEAMAVATADIAALFEASPADRGQEARWMSARFNFGPSALVAGLPFLPGGDSVGPGESARHFAWMPS